MILISTRGSTFWFTARLQVSTGDEPPIIDIALTPPADINAIAGAHILVAEDNEIVQEVTKELLNDAGAKVAIAENGAQAVEMVKSGHFDLILMDMQMPVMDGLTATREIRKLPGFESPRVSRRLLLLRRWSHEEDNEIRPGST